MMAKALINANLTGTQKEVVETYFTNQETCKLVGLKFGIPLTIAELSCLKKDQLLNNEVVNFYLEMLLSLVTQENAYVFNTFLFGKVQTGDDFTGWLQNVPKTATTFFVPINIPNLHWYFAVIDTKERTIKVYNSVKNLSVENDETVLQTLAKKIKQLQYFSENEGELDVDSEQANFNLSRPSFIQQGDNSSCGVFMLVGIDCLWRNVQLPGSVDANNIRKIIALRIIEFGKASVDQLEEKYYYNNESYKTQEDCLASLLIEIEE